MILSYLCSSVHHLWLNEFVLHRCSSVPHRWLSFSVAAWQAHADHEAAERHPAPAVDVARPLVREVRHQRPHAAEDAREADAETEASQRAHRGEHAEEFGDAV